MKKKEARAQVYMDYTKDTQRKRKQKEIKQNTNSAEMLVCLSLHQQQRNKHAAIQKGIAQLDLS